MMTLLLALQAYVRTSWICLMLSTTRECAGHAICSTAAIATISQLVHCGRMDVILASLTNGVMVVDTQWFTVMSQVGTVDL